MTQSVDPETPARRLDRLRTAMVRWRIRVAHWMLLPELSHDSAQDLREQVQLDGKLSQGYVLMCALSAGIAALGLLQSSTAVVIGAMLISPLMQPIAALGFGFASLDGRRIRDAARVVLIGAAIGILTGILLTWLSPIRNATPEILARTQPTLLDFGVALLSGLAGGYATVIGKGGTAIGVAIATALMPPLATVGYGIGVLQPSFAFGALLLFLTNLSAIAFSFALIARLSGAARPLHRVEWEPRYIIAGLAAFAALATPLAATLLRVVHEASLRNAANHAILAQAGKGSTIAQLDASWPLFGSPKVTAVVVTPNYGARAPELVTQALNAELGTEVSLSLQQVLAADLPAQTRAMVDAAMERTVTGINSDVPPFGAIRASIALPTRGIWTNRSERIVNVEPFPAPGWELADYRAAEQRAGKVADGWTVRILPPVSPELRVNLDPANPATDGIAAADAAWAIARWGLNAVDVRLRDGAATDNLKPAFDQQGIGLRISTNEEAPEGVAVITILPPPPPRN